MANSLAYLPAQAGVPTSSNGAQLDVSGAEHPCLDFDAAADESAVFEFWMPEHYAGGTITAVIAWFAAATSGNVVWNIQIDRKNAGASMSIDSYAAAQAATAAANGTANALTYTSISLTQAQADSIAAGEAGALKLTRDADNASDTMSGDARVSGVYLKE